MFSLPVSGNIPRTFPETSPGGPRKTTQINSLFSCQLHTHMSLINLSISNLETNQLMQTLGHLLSRDHKVTGLVLQHTLPEGFPFSYFGGLLLCMYGLVFFVYVGGMALIGLLSTMYQENKQQLLALQRLVEKQELQMEALQKELEKQGKDTQTMYNALVYDSGDRERTVRGHGQQLTEQSNNLLKVSTAIQNNTTTCANHSEMLQRLIRHIHEQNYAINLTRAEVEKHTQQLQHVTKDVDNYTSYVEAVDESCMEFTEQLQQLQITMTEAIDQLSKGSQEKAPEQLELQLQLVK